MKKAQRMEEGYSMWLSKTRETCWEVVESDLSEVSKKDFVRWAALLSQLGCEARELSFFLDSCRDILREGVRKRA